MDCGFNFWEIVLPLVVAGILGGIIGLEREFRAKEAGVRTHFLVAIGSALFMIISLCFEGDRIAAAVVSGIGFIGAGTIIFHKNKVLGLTTAAGLWVTAAVGLACGCEFDGDGNFYLVAALVVVLSLICLETMHRITNKIGEKTLSVSFSSLEKERVLEAVALLREKNFLIDTYKLLRVQEGETLLYKVELELRTKRQYDADSVITLLGSINNITIESME